MTFYQLIQEVSQLFPDVKYTQIKIDLNKKYKDFASRTGLIKSSYNETIVSTTTTYTFASDVDRITSIGQYTTAGVPVDYPMSYQIDGDSITFYDFYGDYQSAMDGSVGTLTYYYIAIPDDMTDNDDVPDLPKQLHSAISQGVISEYFAKFPSLEQLRPDGTIVKVRDFNASTFWGMKYEKMIIDGKKIANLNTNETSGGTYGDQY